jgi:hypothetical protein
MLTIIKKIYNTENISDIIKLVIAYIDTSIIEGNYKYHVVSELNIQLNRVFNHKIDFNQRECLIYNVNRYLSLCLQDYLENSWMYNKVNNQNYISKIANIHNQIIRLNIKNSDKEVKCIYQISVRPAELLGKCSLLSCWLSFKYFLIFLGIIEFISLIMYICEHYQFGQPSLL